MIVLSVRVQYLREAHERLVHTKFRTTKALSIWNTGSNVSDPVVIRKARALELIMENTPAIILDHELIVGLRTLYSALDPEDKTYGSPTMLPVKPATLHYRRYYPRFLTDEEAEKAMEANSFEGEFTSHVPFGTRKVMEQGLGGIKEEALEKMSGLLEASDAQDKINFLKAVIITIDTASQFIRKHAVEARKLATTKSDPKRCDELDVIAETCEWIATEPPRSFQEATQLFWVCCLVMAFESQSCIPIGRFDQDLSDFLERDLANSLITYEEALELVECLWIKLNFESDLSTDTCRNITLGGQDENGDDATNTLTFLCLEASLNLRLADPKVNVRFHKGSPGKLMTKCVEMVKEGLGGFPAFYNDEAILEGLEKMGVPKEEARLYSCDGCQEIILPGKGDFYPVHTAVNFLDCVQKTMGVKPYLYEIGGVEPEMPERRSYGSFDEFLEAYNEDLDEMIKGAVELGNIRDSALAAYSPVPFLSSTLEGCIENAKDKTAGGCTYNWTGCNGQSLATGMNSLAAVKKMVYDEKIISLDELRAVLEDDWADDERLRQYALNVVPKWGNDDDYVDSIAVKVVDHFIEEVMKYRNPRGGPYYPGIFTFHHVSRGIRTSASPDGRHAGETVSTHLTPHAGTDKAGPTSTVNSALKVFNLRAPEGTALDIRFHPTTLMGEEGVEKLSGFIKAFMRQGGTVIQFNVVDSETLLKAQADPEQYRSLLVRVWGFSAYFTTLTREYQDEIIARTEHGLG